MHSHAERAALHWAAGHFLCYIESESWMQQFHDWSARREVERSGAARCRTRLVCRHGLVPRYSSVLLVLLQLRHAAPACVGNSATKTDT